MARNGKLLMIAAGVAVLAAGQQVSSIATLVDVVQKSVAHHDSDNKLAGKLHKLVLAQSLDDRVIEELESEGAGPKSVAEMLDLRDVSAGLPAPEAMPEFPEPPLPMRPEQDAILKAAAEHAASYSAGLPDFICTEMVRRFDDIGGTGKWKARDVLSVKLTFFGHRENYQLAAINGRPTQRNYESIGGAVSEGEFGSDLVTIFNPQSKTYFRWDHWTHLRKHVAHVFYYKIDRSEARYRLEFGMGDSPHVATTVGEHGYVYVDRDTGEILRLNRSADISADFPVRKAMTLLDYDYAAVAGKQYLLPLRAEIRMATDYLLTRNQLEFTAYRKFSGDSTITFDSVK